MVTIPNSFLLRMVVFVFLLFGLPALFVPGRMMNALQKFMKNDETVVLGGFLVFILAVLFFVAHYALHGVWSVIFIILGWLSVIKGIAMTWYPKLSAMGGKVFYGKKRATMMVGIFLILLAVFLVWSTIIRF